MTKAATHLIKVAVEAALGLRAKLDVFGDDYPTPDGSCVRDYIHVSDLARAHSDALRYLRGGGSSLTANCGYGHGFSVLEVIDTVKRVAGVDFKVETAPRREGDPAQIVASSHRARETLGWQPRFDDLSVIVAHALAWEQALSKRGRGAPQGTERRATARSRRRVAQPRLSLDSSIRRNNLKNPPRAGKERPWRIKGSRFKILRLRGFEGFTTRCIGSACCSAVWGPRTVPWLKERSRHERFAGRGPERLSDLRLAAPFIG